MGVMYRGAAPANQAVIAGDVPITFDNVGNAINNISSGLVRPLAITSTKRSPLLPNVPTMEEAGIKGVEADAWFAIFAPANTPPNIVAWLNAKANEVFSESDVSARFTALGMTLPLGSSESLGLFVNSETLRWGSVIQRAGIRLP